MNCQGESQEICWHCQDPDCQILPEKNIQCVSCKELFTINEISDLNDKCYECCENDWHEQKAAEDAEEARKNRRRQCKCMHCGTQYSSYKHMVKGGLGYTGQCVNCLNTQLENMFKEEGLPYVPYDDHGDDEEDGEDLF